MARVKNGLPWGEIYKFCMNKGMKIFFLLFSIFILLLLVAGVYGFFWVKNLTPEKIVENEFIKKQVGEENQDLLKLLPQILGFDSPKTYLFLFVNNTELRPGGGFIGVYATVRFDQGHMEILALDGTENLDRQVPQDWVVAPPRPITEHLKVDRWYFRDSNWSPDFSESAKKALEFYRAEGGVAAGDIQTVFAFTPTILEELLKITGPFVIQNIEFTSDNVIEKLEYEVEYGYDDKGIVHTERKQIIKPFMLALLGHLQENLFENFSTYLSLLDKMGKEKQILVYSSDKNFQEVLSARGWTGKVEENKSGDYLLWVDANLAALKTDHALERFLNYQISRSPEGRFLASAQMLYKHQGGFDWRTTRYRTYVRIFVPIGSELIEIQEMNEMGVTKKISKFDQGEELGKKWFGTFISIEPGENKFLNFNYFLPVNIMDNDYQLLVQKQLGTVNHGLTLDLNFGKNITAAEPAEAESEWGNEVYKYSGNLREDRKFEINF